MFAFGSIVVGRLSHASHSPTPSPFHLEGGQRQGWWRLAWSLGDARSYDELWLVTESFDDDGA